MATFSVKPTEGQDPWGATDLAWRSSVEAAVNASEVTIDKSAGIKVSVQDNAAGRKQLIYGDTGSRDVSSLLLNGWTATAFQITRFAGYLVELRIIGLSGSGASTGVVATLPPGFQVGSTGAGPRGTVVNAAGVVTGRLQVGSDINANALTVNGDVTMMWRTNQAWPATLPGAAIGTIPNA